jgi:hypothetical protein
MSGTVGIVANDSSRYTLFSVALNQLKPPPGTMVDWALSTDVVRGRNKLVERLLEGDSQWLLFMDDDHVFPGDLLERLLSHDKPVVGSLYLRRQAPFAPLAFSHKQEGLYQTINLQELPGEGLLKVQAVGTAGLLVKREVFEAIKSPWFEYGQTERWDASEDIIFCEKAIAAGFEVFCDLGSHLGHMTPTAIWPSWVDQEWAVGFSVADGTRLYIPIETPISASNAADSKEEVAASG